MAKVVAKTKAKKKKWVGIVAPKIFNEKPLGEAYVVDPQDIVGRHISANMMNVTGEAKKQNINLHFQIKEIKEGKGQTFTRGFEMTSGSLKRFVRRGREKIDDSFRVMTKDDLTVRIKPLIITSSNTSNAVVTRIRNEARKKVAEEFSKHTYGELVQLILRYEFQKGMKNALGKIHPLRNFEVRVLRLLDNDKVPEERLVAREKPKVEKKAVPKEEKKEEKEVKDDKKEVKKEKKEEKKEEKTEKKEVKKEKKDDKKETKTKKTTSKKDE